MRRALVLALVLAAAPVWAVDQAGPPAAGAASGAAQPATAAPASQPPAPAAAPYSYNPDGRRDPFLSLTGTGGDSKAAARPTAAGLAGIRVEELAVRGIMQSRDRLVAMIEGPDKRTYLIHQGDKLADGVVKSIAPDALVLVQDVTDPRAKEKTREVRKRLHSSETDKE